MTNQEMRGKRMWLQCLKRVLTLEWPHWVALSTHDAIYVTGGCVSSDANFGSSKSDSFYKYDPKHDSWTGLPEMYTARDQHALIAVGAKQSNGYQNDYLYALGG